MSVVIVGSVALDTVETPAGRRADALGGSATYASCAASLFSQAKMVGVVGDDFAEEHVSFLRSRGIDLSGLEVAPGKTFRWGGVYFDDERERETTFTELNVFEQFAPKLSEAHRAAEIVFLGKIHPSLQLGVLDQVKSPRLSLCDTMNLWLDTALPEVAAVLDRVDVALMNDGEAKQYCETGSAITAGKRLLERHRLGAAVVKQGEHGAILVQPDGLFLAPSYPLETVVDPTGAGDSFAGALAGYLDAQPELTPAAFRLGVVYGALVASFIVQNFGLDGLRELTRADVEARLEEWLAMTRVTAAA